jgi:uncharacterized protein (UPF0333 family)
MFNNKFNKKAQAAIEFLMTYGWMLLVVLIVGALVFSFVDFGSLLPNKVDISTQNIKGDSANSAAYGTTYAVTADQDKIFVAFSFTGGQKATVNTNEITMTTNLGKECNAINLSNDRLTGAGSAGPAIDINFLSGHPGMIIFDCTEDNAGGTGANVMGALLSQDVIEGTVTIGVKDSTRGTGARAIPNTGAFRLSIQ